MHYGDITRNILESLAEGGEIMIDVFFSPHYAKSRMGRALLGIDSRYSSRKAAKHSFSSTLSSLKRQGLVAATGPKSKTIWSITPEGRAFLKKPRLPRNSKDAKRALPPEDGITRLITFDIPEAQKQKRRWLRAELLSCGFSSLQKSVLIGMRPLPEELMENIHMLGLEKYLHIVRVDRKGTLERERGRK